MTLNTLLRSVINMRIFKIAFRTIVVLGITVVLLSITAKFSLDVHQSPPAQKNVTKSSDPQAISRLQMAIGFKTISKEGDQGKNMDPVFVEFGNFLRKSYPLCFSRLSVESLNDGALLLTWNGIDTKSPGVLFAAHMDVVPAEGDWITPPFSGELKDGFVWGRGTLDDKGQLLALVEACESLQSTNFTPKKTIYFAFGHDEEIGGTLGAKAIAARLRSRNVRLHAVLDEGLTIYDKALPGLSKPLSLIGISQKGYVTLQLKARSEGGHSSMPKYPTAIARIGIALAKLESRPFPARLTPAVRSMLAVASAQMNWPFQVIFGHLWLTEPIVLSQMAKSNETEALIRTSVASTLFHAGIKENVLPTEAMATVNLRILPGTTIASAIGTVKDTIRDSQIEIIQIPGAESEAAMTSSTDAKFYGDIESVLAALWPNNVIAPSLIIGLTDSRHYQDLAENIYGHQPLEMTKADLSRLHGRDERISVDNYEKLIAFYRGLISLQ